MHYANTLQRAVISYKYKTFWQEYCNFYTKLLILMSKFNRAQKMQSQQLVVVAEYNSYIEAQMAKSVVGSAGIYAEIRNEYMSTAYAVAIPPQLLVPYEDLEQARALLRIHP